MENFFGLELYYLELEATFIEVGSFKPYLLLILETFFSE